MFDIWFCLNIFNKYRHISGDLNQRHISPKNIKHYLLYDIYRDYLSTVEKLGGDVLYQRPVNGKRSVSVRPDGINKSEQSWKKCAPTVELEGYYTNHPDKRTCVTILYQAAVLEQEIMARTGNKSVESVRININAHLVYKHAEGCSNVLEPQTGDKTA